VSQYKSEQKVEILGVKIDKIDYQSALAIAKKLIDGGGKHYVVTPNPEFIVLAQKDLQFKEILNKADLSIPDGIGLVWLSRMLGEGLRERVTGADLLEGLAGLAEEHGFNLFLLGAKEGIAGKAANVLKKRYPKLTIAGNYAGDADPQGDRETLVTLQDKKIDVLAVAYGPPKQEKWIVRNLPFLNVKLAIGVGGALDYIIGEKQRAPVIIRRMGLEWLFRLILEPSRLKRQLTIPVFTYLLLKDRLRSLINSH
jgi:N-acetylglucosaminyldiphosphoundecaprenol N-acetyl-beta-D-mannosaminyltransferase